MSLGVCNAVVIKESDGFCGVVIIRESLTECAVLSSAKSLAVLFWLRNIGARCAFVIKESGSVYVLTIKESVLL